MDEPLTQAQAPEKFAGAIRIELQADPTLGYASIQNAVPVVRSLRLTNGTEERVEGLEVIVACNPPFARGTKLRFESLAPGESRLISPLDLHPDHSYLCDLQEGMSASITATVLRGTEELLQHNQPIQVLAYDQWAGTRALPELLAAFSMPNNPAVDVLVGKASKLLRKSHPEPSRSDGDPRGHRGGCPAGAGLAEFHARSHAP